MLLTMIVSLYTSRIILDILGVEDYGIYNVVGGVVTMFAFLNGTISSVTQRFLTFEIGTKNSNRLKAVFNTAMCIHWGIAFVILILAETIGLWFVQNHLVIPTDRVTAAFWVYQFSIFSTLILIISIPYNACIVAHEKMSTFAFISVFEVFLKLLLVTILAFVSYDRLVLYALLMLMVQIIVRSIYTKYCITHFEESNYHFVLDKILVKEMASFTSWSLFGGFANVGMNQGLNILINVFFGPIVNAARAVTNQIDNAVQGLVVNFQVALNPQIIKYYAAGELAQMHKLVFLSCKYSFFLMLFISLPIIVEAAFFLNIWLVDVPDHTINFLRINLLIMLINSMSTPVMTAANATGNIKNYQIVVGSILLLIIPFAYLALCWGGSPEIVYYVVFVVSAVAQIARILVVKPIVKFSVRKFIKDVYSPVFKVFGISIIVSFFIHSVIGNKAGYLIFELLLIAITIILAIYYFGMKNSEKDFFIRKIYSVVSTRINNMFER